MFAWPALKNLSRFEINKQNLKNVIHGSKTKLKKKKKSLVFPRLMSPGKGYKVDFRQKSKCKKKAED